MGARAALTCTAQPERSSERIIKFTSSAVRGVLTGRPTVATTQKKHRTERNSRSLLDPAPNEKPPQKSRARALLIRAPQNNVLFFGDQMPAMKRRARGE